MTSWIRHLALFILVVVGPIATGLWWDASTEVDRGRSSGARNARRAAAALSSEATLRVRAHVDNALAVAHELEDQNLPEVISRGRRGAEEARARAEVRLSEIRPRGGFAWLVDESGVAIVGAEPEGDPEQTRAVSGHPLFQQSQRGFAGDLFWRGGEPLLWAAAAPMVSDGGARGAVLVGWPVDEAFVLDLAKALDVELTLVRSEAPVFSSLDENIASDLVGPALSSKKPTTAGKLPEPLPSPLPGLPLMVGPRAEGLAFTSMAVDLPGSDLDWVVSVPTSRSFEALARRQVNLLAGGGALALIVLFFAVLNHRTYVVSLGRVADHLSDIQLGRGEVELSERHVSPPFRRVVRLVNMTVQRIPSRGLPALSASGAALSAPSRPAAPAPTSPSPSLGLDRVLTDGLEEVERPAPRLEAEDSPVADAIASLSQSKSSKSAEAAGAAPDEIAMAIAALDGLAPVSEGFVEETQRRSASQIRGTPSPELIPIDDEASEISQFPARSEPGGAAGAPHDRGGVRGGGSLALGQAGIPIEGTRPRGSEETAVAPVAAELLAQSAREDARSVAEASTKQDMTVVADVDPKLLSQTLATTVDSDDPDWTHFRSVYDDFVAMRERCGEQTQDLAFDRFLNKLRKNKAKLVEKYNCKTVRFQVYEKEGKAALKATPVRAR